MVTFTEYAASTGFFLFPLNIRVISQSEAVLSNRIQNIHIRKWEIRFSAGKKWTPWCKLEIIGVILVEEIDHTIVGMTHIEEIVGLRWKIEDLIKIRYSLVSF